MKLCFISDIHSNIHAFEKVLKKIKSLNCDELFCCGDIVGYYAYPKECINLIKEHGFKCVLGNHDYSVATGDSSFFVKSKTALMGVDYSRSVLDKTDINFLKNLPKNRTFEIDNKSFYMAHGSPRENLFEYVHPYVSDEDLKNFAEIVKADVVVLGHTHVMMEAKTDDVLFLNPGSVGQPRDGLSKSSFMVFDTESMNADWFRIEYDIKSAAEAVYEKNLPDRSGQRLFEGI